jgi:L-cysteine:1D-myo-inositol 2-amino-2-deoxy-alpha-D-glucopyranoside ligase
MAIRLVLLRHHYRSDWEWLDDELWDAVDTLVAWRRALSLGSGAPADPVVKEVLAALADDLDAPRALAAIDAWADASLAVDDDDAYAPALVARTVDALLGVAL